MVVVLVSALAEALVAAQRRALSAMEKQYVAGKIDADQARELMNAIGLMDDVDQDRLISALAVIVDYGATLPAEPNGTAPKTDDKASDAQLALIAQLVAKHKLEAPDLPLTKAGASAIITAMKDGSYDAAKWRVPF